MSFKNLNGKQVAEAFGVVTKTITRWKEEGLPMNADGKTFNLPDAISWAIDRAKAAVCETKEPDEASRWMTEFRKERALMAKIERRRTEESLVEWSEIERQWAERVGLVTSGLALFSDRLPPILEGKSQPEMRELIRSEVRLLRESYAREGKYFPSVSEQKVAKTASKRTKTASKQTKKAKKGVKSK